MAFAFFLIVFIGSASKINQEYLLIEFSYDYGNFILLDKSLQTGNSPTINHLDDGEFLINLVSDKNKIIYSAFFNPLILYSDSFENNITEGETIVLDRAEFSISVPSFKEMKKIEIFDDNKKVFETGVYDVGAKSCRIK